MMSTESHFTRKSPPWKKATNAGGDTICWLIIAGHLAVMFHRQNIIENHPQSLLGNVYTL
jgi:hypothetical protein